MKTDLIIGKILKPRGLKGELKIALYSEDPQRHKKLKTVKIGSETFQIEKLNLEGAFGYIKFAGIDTIDAAEKLRGMDMSVNRNDLPAPPKDRFYIVDLLGSEVYVGGELKGRLSDVLQYGSADVYVIKLNQGSVSVPVIKGLVSDIDVENGKIVLNDVIFDRVAVFNN